METMKTGIFYLTAWRREDYCLSKKLLSGVEDKVALRKLSQQLPSAQLSTLPIFYWEQGA